MNTKDELIRLLEEQGDAYLSGSALAERFGLTRAAVWKQIRQLEAEGYRFEAETGLGYRLAADNDVVSEQALCRYLSDSAALFTPEVFSTIDSTNVYLRKKAPECPDWHTVVAGHQTAGRGRRGRSFFSPAGSGIYLSILQRPQLTPAESTRITTAAAVAACLAIEECTEQKPGIKWVNDVFVAERKVCGILTEASVSLESGGLDWAVMGIGFNVYAPEEGFPEELKDIAGAISPVRKRDLRVRLAASFMKQFYRLCQSLKEPDFAREYRSRCFLLGQPVNVLRPEGPQPALALDVDDECHLLVRYDDGTTELLASGEVSVRPRREE